MNSPAVRFIAVALLLLFAWRGEIGSLRWPPASKPAVAIDGRPDDEAMSWTSGINVNGMTPRDRIYLSSFYQALAFIKANDGKSQTQVMDSTQKFAAFHAGSLQLAVDKGDVGRYPGLGASIDRAFFAAAGDRDDKPIDADTGDRLIRCSKALAWRFAIHADE